MTPRLAALCALFPLAVGCGRIHELKDGAYQFALTSVIRDDCNLAAKPEVFAIGSLITTGHVVALDYQLFNIRLVGNYLAADLSGVERLSVDGSAANVTSTINGNACLVDLAVLHVDATTRSASQFDGTFSIRLDSQAHNECVCEFWFNYTATHL